MSHCPIQEDDYVIHETWRGYYCRDIGNTKSIDDTVKQIAYRMEREQFWPNVWHVNDHGNLSCIAIKTIKGRYISWRYTDLPPPDQCSQ